MKFFSWILYFFMSFDGLIYAQIEYNLFKDMHSHFRSGLRTFYESSNYNQSSELDTIYINVNDLDTNLYSEKYKFWKEVNITNSEYYPMPVKDLNNNGYPELYGFTGVRPYGNYGPAKVLEMNETGSFNELFSYDSTIFIKGIGSIKGDGRQSIYFHTIPSFTQSGCFYSSNLQNSIPDNFDFVFYYNQPNGLQINDLTIGDFNKNGKADCAFVAWLYPQRFIIAEYDSLINNFRTVFTSQPYGSNLSGLCIEDFDQDGWDEIIFASETDSLYSVEALNDSAYHIIYSEPSPLDYPWLFCKTDDIDRNGYKEFWVGSVDYYTGTATTLIAYEAPADNQYKQVARVELQHLTTLLGAMDLQSSDIDNDNRDELIVSVGNELLVLKFTGHPNAHNYNVYYYKNENDNTLDYKFCPCTFYDMNNDGYKDLILPHHNITTNIYLYNTLIGMSDEIIIPTKVRLLQNYPNPFNPVTTINYSIPVHSSILLQITDILGNEIATLVNEEKAAGSYQVSWNGSALPSGIYFYRLQAGSFVETRKMILLK